MNPTPQPLPFTDIPDRDALSASTRRVIEPFIRLFYRDRAIRVAMETYARSDYVQHNPGITDGRDAAIEALEFPLANPRLHLDVQRVLVDGPYAMIHLHAWKDGERGGSVMDLYRIENGKLVEHWDVIQQVPAQASNAHPFF